MGRSGVLLSLVGVVLALVAGLLYTQGGTTEGDGCLSLADYHPLHCPTTSARLADVFKAGCAGVTDDQYDSSQVASMAAGGFLCPRRIPQPGEAVVVVGAGPVGLMNVLALLEEGIEPSRIVVLEERTQYTRDTWFDLDEQMQRAMQKWGMDGIRDMDVIRHEGTTTVSVRCQLLERFLSRAATAAGVHIHYGMQFITVCEPSDIVYRATGTEGSWNCTDLGPVHVIRNASALIAADGSRSAARNALGLSYPAEEVVFPVPSFEDDYDDLLLHGPEEAETVAMTGLAQVSVILRLAPRPDGSCPPCRQLLPWEPSYDARLHGVVTHVFKRLFSGYCEIQVLLTEEHGRAVFSQFRSGALPWRILLSVAQCVLEEDMTDVEALQRAAAMLPDGSPYVKVFPIAIHRAMPSPVVTQGNMVGFVVGDAKMTAYYRLGIGINAAAADLAFTRQLAVALRSYPANAALVRQISHTTVHQTERNARYQVAAVFFEAYCDLLVLQDDLRHGRDLLDRMLVYVKSSSGFSDAPLRSMQAAMQYCTIT